MGVRRNSVVALWFCLFFFATALLSSARNIVTISGFSGLDRRPAGRSLLARLDDYDDPSANRGHDPPPPNKANSGSGGGGRRIP